MSENKDEVYPVAQEDTDSPRRKGLTVGRIVNASILCVHVAIFITAIAVIGVIGNFLVQLNYHPREGSLIHGHCPIFTVYQIDADPAQSDIRLAPDGVCVWFIAGHVIMACAAIAFFVMGIVRVIFAMDIGIIGTLVEVGVTALLLLLAFSVAVSLSIGIAITCEELGKKYSDSVCSQSAFPSGRNRCFSNGTYTSDFCWYNDAQAAQGAAWVIHVFLIVFLVICIVRLCIWGKRFQENRRRQALENYDRLDNTPAAV